MFAATVEQTIVAESARKKTGQNTKYFVNNNNKISLIPPLSETDFLQ